MGLPAAGYLSNSARTVAEMKTALEDVRDFVADMLGGVARSALTIASGAIVPGDGTSGGVHTVDTEAAAASDDLTTITQTNTPDGRLLILYAANASRVVTVKHGAGGTGQILLTYSADLVLDALDKWVMVQRRGTDWVEVLRSYGVDYYDEQDVKKIAPQIHDGMLAPAARLAISYASASTATITADAVTLFDSAGHAKKFATLNETLNIANTGANGRDVADNAGNEQASVWYHLFAIGKDDGTLDVFASQVGYPGHGTSIYTRLPSGYTWAGYVGAIYNDSGSNLIQSHQRGSVAHRAVNTVLSAGTATSLTSVSLAAAVPPTAQEVLGDVYETSTSGTGAGNFALSPTSDGVGQINFYSSVTSTGNGTGGPFSLPLRAHSLHYLKSGSVNVTINVTGWRY